jgi:hypothetical protein
METIKMLYSTFTYDRTKERFEMILEPFQAMTQLALLSYYPCGSKISITNNILQIQEPFWTQGVIRKYNADKKDDLVFLFSVIKRFYHFYGFLLTKNNKTKQLFETIIELCKAGLDKLIQTYSKSDTANLTQTLKMYKALLDKPDAFNIPLEDTNSDIKNVDDIFKQIVSLYDDSHYIIVLNTLMLLNKYPENYINYLNSINSLMENVNVNIRKWICDNIVF